MYHLDPAQERDADVITLHDAKTDDFYHMTMEEYLRIAKPHSALPSGHKGKSKEVSKKKFIDNSSDDLYQVADSFIPKYGTLFQ